MRLDKYICDNTSLTRSLATKAIKSGRIKVNGIKPKSGSLKIIPDTDQVLVDGHLVEAQPSTRYFMMNKPQGYVCANSDGEHALVFDLMGDEINVSKLHTVGRLDKDTTGLMVVAKNLSAHAHIVDQLQTRTMGREYEAIISGVMTGGGTVNEPIARSSKNRKKMAVSPFGKHAVTHYRVLSRFNANSHIRVKLETGRTHQIRVHMAHIKYPLVGDKTYSGRFKLPAGASDFLKESLKSFPRQALHAKKLTLTHPKTGEEMSWEADLPDDMLALLEALNEPSQSD